MSDEQVRAVEARLFPIEEVVRRLGMSRSRVFQLLASGDIRSVKCGKRRLVSEQSLFDFIDSLENGSAAE